MLENPVMEERRQDRLGRFCLPGSDISMMRITEGMLLLGAFLLGASLCVLEIQPSFLFGVVDFVFFSALAFFCSLYRPGWAFLLFISLLPFEMIDLIGYSATFHSTLSTSRQYSDPVDSHSFRDSSTPISFDAFPVVRCFADSVWSGWIALNWFCSGRRRCCKTISGCTVLCRALLLSRQFLGEVRDVRR